MNSYEQRGNEQTLPTFMATLSTWPQLTNGCHSCSAGLMPARQSVKFLASKSLLASMPPGIRSSCHLWTKLINICHGIRKELLAIGLV